jgi:hypothetical protein
MNSDNGRKLANVTILALGVVDAIWLMTFISSLLFNVPNIPNISNAFLIAVVVLFNVHVITISVALAAFALKHYRR